MLLIVHGGAGNRKPSKEALKTLSESLSYGYDILRNGGSSLDAVVLAITILEDSGVFNAGAGGNLQLDGVRRLDASVMEGKGLGAGAVIGLEGIRNPIHAARLVMKTPHVMLTNTGASRIAGCLEPLKAPDEEALRKLEKIKTKKKAVVRMYNRYFSTVGAVALDGHGDLASGSSTGGVAAMLPGRVGDTPVIGAGVYADNSSGAVSCTGQGEYILRLSLAKEICMKLKTMSPAQAAGASLKRLSGIGGEAGVIVISSGERFTISHNTKYMASGYTDGKKVVVKEL
ncbi:MAG: isoaspartyl peptidase/L-asparaginase [Nitrospirae bacterium]|nr:isoaspartyl peptidase/L-asparaginase [Nitrospirota bacterium]